MKAFWIIAAICAIGCSKSDSVQPASTPQELLTNGDVEAGSGVPNGWWQPPPAGTIEVTWSTEESASASHSLKIENASADASNFAFWAQTYPGPPMPTGKDVVLTVKIKGQLTGPGVSIVIRGDDTLYPSGTGEQFISTQGMNPISGTFDWTTYKVTLTSVSASLKSLTIYFVYLNNTSGKVYFDDAKLTY